MIDLNNPNLTRHERVEIALTLEREDFEKHRETLAILDPDVFALTLEPSDVCRVAYHIDINYYGQVVKALEAILTLHDANALKSSSVHALDHGYCMIEDVLEKLRSIKEKTDS